MKAGFRIAQEREAQGLSQETLATRVKRLGGNISQTGIDKFEKRDGARPRYIKEIAMALGVSEDWILSGKLPKERNLAPDLQALLAEMINTDPDDQARMMIVLQAQLAEVRQRKAKMADVQAAEAQKAKPRK